MKLSNSLVTLLILSLTFINFSTLLAQSETRNVGSFSGVKMGISGNLYITQGSPQKVVIEAPEEALKRIETEIVGGNLIIRQQNDWKWWRNWSGSRNIKIYITAPKLDHLAVSGSGSIESENTIRADNMYVGVSGSGDMDLDLDIQDLESRVSGSGNMDLRGSARDIEVSVSGSGNVDAEDMSADNCDIRISGSGNCRVQVKNRLESRVSGSGNVYYRGNPEKVNNSSSGSGSIRKIG